MIGKLNLAVRRALSKPAGFNQLCRLFTAKGGSSVLEKASRLEGLGRWREAEHLYIEHLSSDPSDVNAKQRLWNLWLSRSLKVPQHQMDWFMNLPGEGGQSNGGYTTPSP